MIDLVGSAESFNSNILNLGDIKTPSKTTEVLAVIFDLEGFTKFTGQVDSKLVIPDFLSDFFDWLFDELKILLDVDGTAKTFWAELPFYSKFLGDGVLFLWRIDTAKIMSINNSLNSKDVIELTQEFICNIIGALHDVCISYKLEFVKKCDSKYSDIPQTLRCGVARGDVFSLGNNMDYVGSCINIASRLQKVVGGLSFCVSARGIDAVHFNESYSSTFIKKKVSIRGIGDNEIVYVAKQEFHTLTPEQKILFK